MRPNDDDDTDLARAYRAFAHPRDGEERQKL